MKRLGRLGDMTKYNIATGTGMYYLSAKPIISTYCNLYYGDYIKYRFGRMLYELGRTSNDNLKKFKQVK